MTNQFCPNVLSYNPKGIPSSMYVLLVVLKLGGFGLFLNIKYHKICYCLMSLIEVIHKKHHKYHHQYHHLAPSLIDFLFHFGRFLSLWPITSGVNKKPQSSFRFWRIFCSNVLFILLFPSGWVLLGQGTTRTPAFWGYPPPPHDYPYHWVILDPKSKENKVKLQIKKKRQNFNFFNIETNITRDTPSEVAW